MIVIAHQTIGVNPPASHLARVPQRLKKQLPVSFASENRFPPIPPRHHVIESAGILDANTARHNDNSYQED
jgi:hypothetical protein